MANDAECEHTDDEHEELHHLVHHLVHQGQAIVNPRVALIVADNGEIHFASTLPSHESARMLFQMAERVRRYGSAYVRDHFDRGAASTWN